MHVFISWSGDRARQAAEALRDWLRDVIPSLRPWLSSIDISPGRRWSAEIAAALEASRVGIIVVTNENRERPWIMFEAGAVSKAIGNDNLVIPFLLDFEPSALGEPLGQFNAVRRDEDGVWKLVQALNATMTDERLESARLERQFQRCWEELKSKLDAIPPTEEAPPEFNIEKAVKLILEKMQGLERRESAGGVGHPTTVQGAPAQPRWSSRLFVDALERLLVARGLASFEQITAEFGPEWTPDRVMRIIDDYPSRFEMHWVPTIAGNVLHFRSRAADSSTGTTTTTTPGEA